KAAMQKKEEIWQLKESLLVRDLTDALKIIDQLRLEKERLEEQKDEEIRELKAQLQKKKEEAEAQFSREEFPRLGNTHVARPYMETEFYYSGNATTSPKIKKITNQLYNVKVEFDIPNCTAFGTTEIIDTGASACCINKKVIPKEALEPLTQTVIFNGLNLKQQATHRIKQGYFLIEENKFKIPLIYAFDMRDNNGIEMLIGANFLITIYKKVTKIKTSNQTEIAEIAELEVSEEEFLEINESIYFNQEVSRTFQEQFKPVIDRLKQQGYIGEELLKQLKKNGELCKLDIINPDITIEDRPLKNVTPAMEDLFRRHVDSLLKISAINPSKSRHRMMAMIVNLGTTIDIFDLKSGFHQVAMDEESIPWTAFLVPGGLYEWLVMPFGLKNALAVFQRKMDTCFRGTESFIAVYIDDILKIVNFNEEELKTKKGLRSFLGILNYARNHIPKLGILLRPLYVKTNAHGDKRLKPSYYELVRKIKGQVQNLPDLEIPQENSYIILETDVCMEGWGGIVKWKKSKEDLRSSKRICAYASDKFSTTQSTIDAEINACINTLEKLKIYYLDKQEVTLRTDCQAIISFYNKTNSIKSSRVRWIKFADAVIGTGELAAALYSVEKVLQSPNAFQKNMKTTCEEVMKISNHFQESSQKLSSHLKNQEHYTNVTSSRPTKPQSEWINLMHGDQSLKTLNFQQQKKQLKLCDTYKQSYNAKPRYALENQPKITTGQIKEKMFEFKIKKPEESSSNWKPWHKDWVAITSNQSEEDAINDDAITSNHSEDDVINNDGKYRYNRKGFLEDDESSDDSILIVDPGWDDYSLQVIKSNRPIPLCPEARRARITPQQNGVAERRTWTLIEAAKTMLADSNPFGCLVTILNTIDHLGKFDGKADEGFFVRYSLNSKAFRVFNSRTRIVEENLHISDDGMKVDEDLRKDSECKDQEKEDNVNSTNNVNIVGNINTVSSTINVADINKVNTIGGKTSIRLPFDLNMHALEDDSIFDFSRDDEDD
ncbi:Orf y, partial [Tanacetum coccineum]